MTGEMTGGGTTATDGTTTESATVAIRENPRLHRGSEKAIVKATVHATRTQSPGIAQTTGTAVMTSDARLWTRERVARMLVSRSLVFTATMCSCHPAPITRDTPDTRSRHTSEMPTEDGEEGEATDADATNDDDAAMMAMMGMGGFGSTKVRMSATELYEYGMLSLRNTGQARRRQPRGWGRYQEDAYLASIHE